MFNKIQYWHRIIYTYLLGSRNNISFWHGEPELNDDANYKILDQYYMKFYYKAKYTGSYDENGIPQLNYQGDIGVQYNPIAISQWSLGNYNLWKKNDSIKNYKKFINGADWLVNNLQANKDNVYVWNHNFNWVYKENLIKPWYSGLAQGQGLSVLCRAYKITKNEIYMDAIEKVYKSFSINVENGGVNFIDESGNIWIEEYIMKKEPTHILNGFIWGLWGIYDFWLLTNDKNIKKRFDKYIKTINENIEKYDIGYWSLYELSDKPILMRASIFYHKLHIIQLKILYLMTDNKNFNKKSKEWSNYLGIKYYRFKATFMKILFKIFYY